MFFFIPTGGTRPLDAFSVLQEGQPRRYGFLHVAWGFISDVDFDSEVYRWMGGMRFTVTAVEKIVLIYLSSLFIVIFISLYM